MCITPDDVIINVSFVEMLPFKQKKQAALEELPDRVFSSLYVLILHDIME
jgi:hypothetical protein